MILHIRIIIICKKEARRPEEPAASGISAVYLTNSTARASVYLLVYWKNTLYSPIQATTGLTYF